MAKPVPISAFQQQVLASVRAAPNQQASTCLVAARAFPDKWANTRARGALSAQVAKAGHSLVAKGLLSCVLPPKRVTGAPVLCAGFRGAPSSVPEGFR